MKFILNVFFIALAFGACANNQPPSEPPSYVGPVDIYRHNIFETPHEFKSLDTGTGQVITLNDQTVFEGIAPIGFRAQEKNYIIATQSDLDLGAYLALYAQNEQGNFELVDRLPPIGRKHRWLALAFVHDLDGNGFPEVAYVETPHLGRVAKLFEVVEGKLIFRGEYVGVYNHNIGSDEILGGLVLDGSLPKWRLLKHATDEWIELIWDGESIVAANSLTN